MNRIETDIPDLLILEPKVLRDERGLFMEAYNRRTFEQIGIVRDWVQQNVSRSSRGVLRGMHYQLGKPQAKIVRVSSGTAFDVAVDIRRGSPSFGKWFGTTLSSENMRMLFVPEGFAHGFLVLSNQVEFTYMCSDFYAPGEERGIHWKDPEVGIEWPLPRDIQRPVLSLRDETLPLLSQLPQQDLPVVSMEEALR